jgi:DNA-binding MarR family transcriptional regulator
MESAFLLDVAVYPFSGVVERYRRLDVSRRKGNAWKESLVAKGLIDRVEIPTRGGRITLMQPTESGRKLLAEHGHKVPDRSRWGSLEHEYWKRKVTERFTEAGYEAHQEVPVNGFTDIIAEKAGRRVAIEIETGKSDWRANLLKNRKKGFLDIIVAATNETTRCQIEEAVSREFPDSGIRVVQAQDLAESRDMSLFQT